jgi:hypothetical protein
MVLRKGSLENLFCSLSSGIKPIVRDKATMSLTCFDLLYSNEQNIMPPRQIIAAQYDSDEVESLLLKAILLSSFQSLLPSSEIFQAGVNTNRRGKSRDKSHQKDVTTSSEPSTKKHLPSSRPSKPQRSRSNDVAPSKPTRSQSPTMKKKGPTRNISKDVVSSEPKPHGQPAASSTHSITSAGSKPAKSLDERSILERRKVRFDDFDEIREISSFKDFSQKQKQRLWFTKDEMASIREDCLDVVNMVNERHQLFDVEELGGIYGLEKHTKALEIQMKEVTHRCIDTVLDIQNVWPKTEKKDFAAKMYFLQSAKTTLDARVYAFELANEVKNYYEC